jgi:predicted kinase
MMCGLPRSGKSTWIKKNRQHEVILSADDLRYLVYNQRFWQDGEPMLWATHNIILKMLLNQGVDIIMDETNVTPERRKLIIKQALNVGYDVECIWVTTPKETCLDRAIRLNDDIIQPVIERMAKEFIKPEMSEGFKNIIVIGG